MERPFLKRTISSHFGKRIVPGSTHYHHHTGTDYAVPEGSTVRAIADGVVTDRRYHPQNGFVVTIRHDGKRKSKYKHLQGLGDVKAGAIVKAGDPIARVGNTGTASRGPHLHLEAWENGVCVDPENWFGAKA